MAVSGPVGQRLKKFRAAGNKVILRNRFTQLAAAKKQRRLAAAAESPPEGAPRPLRGKAKLEAPAGKGKGKPERAQGVLITVRARPGRLSALGRFAR